jgi:hypothetical protein
MRIFISARIPGTSLRIGVSENMKTILRKADREELGQQIREINADGAVKRQAIRNAWQREKAAQQADKAAGLSRKERVAARKARGYNPLRTPAY